jgi:hypothetical protein
MGERLSPYTFAALYGTSKVCWSEIWKAYSTCHVPALV